MFERETQTNVEPDGLMPRFAADDRPCEALYLDDLCVGQRFTSGSVRVDEAEVKSFAAQYDPQPFHLDEDAARASLFGGLAASGWHTAALTMRLLVDGGLPIAGGVIGAGGEIAWPRPTRPGDVLTVVTDVLDVVPSKSRPDRGLATLRSETRNQLGEPVQIATMKVVVPRRPGQANASTPDATA
jgi:Acyl dehydratase